MKVNIYHVLCNIKVRTIFKQNEAIYRKKELHFSIVLWPIAVIRGTGSMNQFH